MKFRLVIVYALFFISHIAYADFSRLEVTVVEVGLSLNSNRVFVVASPLASDSVCGDKNYYSMKLGEPESYLFYSAALSAMNEGKKMRLQYELSTCLANSPQVDVFWNLNY